MWWDSLINGDFTPENIIKNQKEKAFNLRFLFNEQPLAWIEWSSLGRQTALRRQDGDAGSWQDPREGDLGLELNITMIIFNFTERDESPDTQTGGQANISRRETRQTSAVRFRDLGTRTRDQGCWRGGILEMADNEGRGAHRLYCPANTKSVSWKVQSPSHAGLRND